MFILFRDLTKYGVWRPWLVTVLIFHVTQSPNKIMWIYVISNRCIYFWQYNPHIPGPSPTPAKWLQSFLPARASNSVVHLLKSPPRLSKEFECQGSHSDLHKQNIVTDWNLECLRVIFFPCALRMPPKNRRYTHMNILNYHGNGQGCEAFFGRKTGPLDVRRFRIFATLPFSLTQPMAPQSFRMRRCSKFSRMAIPLVYHWYWYSIMLLKPVQ